MDLGAHHEGDILLRVSEVQLCPVILKQILSRGDNANAATLPASPKGKLVNGSRVGQVGSTNSCGQVGDLDPS